MPDYSDYINPVIEPADIPKLARRIDLLGLDGKGIDVTSYHEVVAKSLGHAICDGLSDKAQTLRIEIVRMGVAFGGYAILSDDMVLTVVNQQGETYCKLLQPPDIVYLTVSLSMSAK